MYLPTNSGWRLTVVLAAIFLCATRPVAADPFTFPFLRETDSPQYTQAVQSLRDNDFDKVIQLGGELLSKNPVDPAAHMLLALAYVGKGEPARAMAQAEGAKGRDGKDAIEIYRNLATTYAKAARYYLALACLKHAMAIAETPEVIHEMGMVYMAQGRVALARPLLEKVLPTKPDYQNLGRVCLRLGDYPNAKIYAQKTLAADPKNASALLLRGTSELLSGETDTADQTLRQLKRDSADSGVVGHYLGLVALVRGDYDAALSEMDGLLKIFPKLREAHLISALCWQMKGKFAAARQSAAAVLAVNPNDAIAELIVAAACLGESRRDEAKTALGKADAIVFEFGPPLLDSLKIVETWNPARAGRFAIANFLLAEGLARTTQSLIAGMESPSSVESPFFAIVKARALLAAGNRQEAAGIYATLASELGKWITPLVELAQLAAADGDAVKTSGYLMEAEKRAGNSVRFHLVAGDLAYRVDRAELAEAHFRRVIALDPKSAVGFNQLAWTLGEKSSRYAEALPLAVTAQRMDPNNPNARDTLGWIYYQLGKFVEAAKIYEPLMKSPPRDSTVLRHMGLVCEKTGRKTQAAEILEQALNISDEFPGAPEAESRLKSLWSSR